MMIHDVTALVGKYPARKRVGRGKGSGLGKRSGRGQKGAGSRSGTSRRAAFEGGQMPYFRRIRKAGFTNAQHRTRFWVVNLSDIASHPSFVSGGEVTPESMIGAGLIRDTSRELKILGDLPEGGLKVSLRVQASRVSKSARSAVEAAGGSVDETGTRRDRVRGIDRNSGDPTPKNLTKKLKRFKARERAAAKAAEASGE